MQQSKSSWDKPRDTGVGAGPPTPKICNPSQRARAFLGGLEENGRAFIPTVKSCDIIGHSRGLKEASLQMGGQIRQDSQFAFDNALRFDMCRAGTVAVLIEVVPLHFVHGGSNLSCCLFLIWLDNLHS